ncbi:MULTISPECIES: hypothetical protein [Salinibaculum]|uniref:hypothetical protein n=1 Tax=Salinibaculum TaxID=2732368 RepID=UPI0030D5D46D
MAGEGQTRATRSHTHERSAELREKIGEDPARFLDRPLFDSGSQYNTEPGWFIQKRIEGIDSKRVINFWLQIEHQLDRGPREKIVEMLERRASRLDEIGERPDRLEERDGRDRPPGEWYIVRDGEAKPWDEVDRNAAGAGVSGTSRALATDGGEGDV